MKYKQSYLYVILKDIVPFSSSVPFDEDDKDASVWYLDHDYLENLSAMFKKVNGKIIRS